MIPRCSVSDIKHLSSKGTKPETETCLSPSPEVSLLAARPLRWHQVASCRRESGLMSWYGSNGPVDVLWRLILLEYAKQRYIPLPVMQICHVRA